MIKDYELLIMIVCKHSLKSISQLNYLGANEKFQQLFRAY
jgi:hypothetical protein